jgi:hypothetical protein
MTNYNDGKWHGWNGGECPVHPDSVGDITYFDGVRYRSTRLGQYDWKTPLMFRVVKEHKEPREFWVTRMTLFDLDGNISGYCYQECSEKMVNSKSAR